MKNEVKILRWTTVVLFLSQFLLGIWVYDLQTSTQKVLDGYIDETRTETGWLEDRIDNDWRQINGYVDQRFDAINNHLGVEFELPANPDLRCIPKGTKAKDARF